jgi:hypothetical protein
MLTNLAVASTAGSTRFLNKDLEPVVSQADAGREEGNDGCDRPVR